ncbi:MAG TPA: site-specific integrase [bacterium]|nr:site-specific integrase [bacterium]
MGLVRRGKYWCIRYYGPDGRQRWETISPNKKEAETVLAQRVYEVRSGKYPILRRRSRLRFKDFARDWLRAYAEPHTRVSTFTGYEWLIRCHLIPRLGDKLLTMLTPKDVQEYVAAKRDERRVSFRTINHSLTVLNEMLEHAVEWGHLPVNPAGRVRKLKIPKQPQKIWMIAEIRRFLFTAPDEWRPLFLVAVFTGLRLGELQALAWKGQSSPNFTTNKLEVSQAHSQRGRTIGPTKSDNSVRAVDMVPSVRVALRELRQRRPQGLVFPGPDGGVLPSWTVHDHGWAPAHARAEVSYIPFKNLRHTYASLLIMAGKHPKYIQEQLGHASAGFTLDTYGHLMDRLPVTPVEWIDDLVFPEGFQAALNLHLFGAPHDVSGTHTVQSSTMQRGPDSMAETQE